MRAYATYRLPGDALDRLAAVADLEVWDGEGTVPRAVLEDAVVGVDALVTTLNDRVDAALLERGAALRVVSVMAVGHDSIDVDACTRRGIVVTNTPGVLTESTADLTMALVLAVARRLPEATAAAHDGSWGVWDPTWMCGMELTGSTIGIVGYGAIGRAVARRAEAFGMRVVHHSRRSGIPLDELLEASDIVSLHTPLTTATRGLIGAGELARMKRSAVLVNTARGAVIDQAALVAALREGTIAAAGLDVAVVEPVPLDDPLLHLPNCVVTPHIGSATMPTRVAMADLAVAGAMAVLAGERPAHVVNPEVQ